ncbi:MAG: DUF2304 family protein [Acidobacteriota bacterium]
MVDSVRLLNVLTVLLVVAFLVVLASVRRERIRVEYSVSWLLAVGLLLVLSRWHWFTQWLANTLGVGDAALALLLLAGLVFLVVLYRLSLRISGLKDSNIKLAQRIAILEMRLETLYEKDERTPAN